MILDIWKKQNLLTFIGIAFAVLGLYFCFIDMVDYSIIMLILSGICDAFDGVFARKVGKGNKKQYGVHLDSLADIVASGILPIAICMALGYTRIIHIIVYIIFIICGLTRLSYYNVNSKDDKSFTGVPITCSTFALPVIYLIQKNEILIILTLLILAILEVSNNIKIKKPNMKIRIMLSIIGIIIIVLIILFGILKIKINI